MCVTMPVIRDAPGRSGHGLVVGAGGRRGELRPFQHGLALVVVEPVLARLEALDVAVAGQPSVRCRVLGG